MSAPRRELKLSKRARRDFLHILAYTERTWGAQQVLTYRALIKEALETLQQQPGIGHKHPALPDTHRIYPVGSHLIVYRDHKGMIEVFRMPHERMSLARQV